MGVTNGFLKLSREEFHRLKNDEDAFVQRAKEYDEWKGYLDMDKAGYELLFILDPPIPNPASGPSLYPNIVNVLSGGESIFPDLDLGYGPAQVVDEIVLKQSIPEFDNLDFNAVLALALDEGATDLLLVEMNEEEFREYHWEYLKGLGEFVKEAVAEDMVVLRY